MANNNPTLLITGASGQLGRLIAEFAIGSAPGNVVLATRSPEKVAGLVAKGAVVRNADFDDPASLEAAFEGIDRVLIVSASSADTETRLRQHRAAISAADQAGVKFIAYTSAPKADDTPLTLAVVHNATEQAIRETGIPFSFLRNNWYIENETNTILAALAGAPVSTSAGGGRVGWAARRDYAQAAATVIAGSGHENTVYELSGPPRTYDELAAILTEVIGRDVPVQHISDEAYAGVLAGAGLPEFVVQLFVGVQGAIREGALDVTSEDLSSLLGRPLTPLSEVIAEIVNAHQAKA